FRYAAMAPRKEPMGKYLEYLKNQVKKANVRMQFNTEATEQSIRQFGADAVVLAHGANNVLLDLRRVEDNVAIGVKTAFATANSLGENVAIVGGGPEGCELADFLASKGKKITLIEMRRVLGLELVAHPRYHLGERLKKMGTRIYINTKVTEIGRNHLVISRRREADQRLDGFDNFIIPTLHHPNGALAAAIQSFVPEVHTIGDSVEGRTALEAVADGVEIGGRL
ncbi:MAG: FAD-dependent oxidoreductase, partial [Planctomycetota bacterium]